MDYRQKYLKYRHKYLKLKIGGTHPTHSTLDPTLDQLIKKQKTHLPLALQELQQNKRKTGHWAWWVFPNNKPGYSEPPPQTFVDKQTAPLLLSHAPPIWQQTLEYLCHLLNTYGPSTIPSIDHGRISFFIKFWDQINPKPDWFRNVLTTLKLYFLNDPSSSPDSSSDSILSSGSSSQDSSSDSIFSPGSSSQDSSSPGSSSDDKLSREIKTFQDITGADLDTTQRIIRGAKNRGLGLEDAVSYYFDTY